MNAFQAHFIEKSSRPGNDSEAVFGVANRAQLKTRATIAGVWRGIIAFYVLWAPGIMAIVYVFSGGHPDGEVNNGMATLGVFAGIAWTIFVLYWATCGTARDVHQIAVRGGVIPAEDTPPTGLPARESKQPHIRTEKEKTLRYWSLVFVGICVLVTFLIAATEVGSDDDVSPVGSTTKSETFVPSSDFCVGVGCVTYR